MFYVYIYFDPRIKGTFIYKDLEFEYEPFYIGKGKNKRLYSHLKQQSRTNKTNKISSIKKQNLEPIIIKYKENLTEVEAFKLEIELIDKVGRKNLKNGPLTNIHEGGKGSNGIGPLNTFYGKHHTDEHKKYISGVIKDWCSNNKDIVEQASIKRKNTLLEINFNHKTFLGKKHTEESKLKMKDSAKGKHTKESNSQYGTMWITNGFENKKIKSKDIIPKGYYKGRKIKMPV